MRLGNEFTRAHKKKAITAAITRIKVARKIYRRRTSLTAAKANLLVRRNSRSFTRQRRAKWN